MPLFVHLTDEKNLSKIKKTGLKLSKRFKGIFCVPLTSNFFISHQWLRELKRDGVKNYIAVHFKLSPDEMVWAGKYFEKHQLVKAHQAVEKIHKLKDPLGFEVFINRKISEKEITKIVHIPQTIGWRYQPHSHRLPITCGCPMCIPKGSIKSAKLREKLEPNPQKKLSYQEIINELQGAATGTFRKEELLTLLRRKKWKANPKELLPLAESKNKNILEDLAITLGYFKYKYVKDTLLKLCLQNTYDSVKESAAESLIESSPKEGLEELKKMTNDSIILCVIGDYEQKNFDKSNG